VRSLFQRVLTKTANLKNWVIIVQNISIKHHCLRTVLTTACLSPPGTFERSREEFIIEVITATSYDEHCLRSHVGSVSSPHHLHIVTAINLELDQLVNLTISYIGRYFKCFCFVL